MKIKILILLLIVGCFSCTNSREPYRKDMEVKPESEMKFDKAKWRLKKGDDYVYRDKMLNDIIYNDTVRSLNKDEILALSGSLPITEMIKIFYTIGSPKNVYFRGNCILERW